MPSCRLSRTLSRRRTLAALAVAPWGPLVAQAAQADSAAVPQTLATVGRPAPAFTLNDLAGRPHALAATVKAHRVTVLNFWATWCAPCVKELPEFDAVWRELRGEGVAVLALNAMENEDKVRAFAQRVPLGFPLLLDPEGEVVGRYIGFSAGLPVTFLIDGRGIVRQRIAAPLDGAALRQRVNAVLQATAAPRKP